MIDPFFFDRLMHAFTTANAGRTREPAGPVMTDQGTLSGTGAPPCRALKEAEAVVADMLRREHAGQVDAHER